MGKVWHMYQDLLFFVSTTYEGKPQPFPIGCLQHGTIHNIKTSLDKSECSPSNSMATQNMQPRE